MSCCAGPLGAGEEWSAFNEVVSASVHAAGEVTYLIFAYSP